MTDQEIQPYLDKQVYLVVPISRRISMSMRETLYSSKNDESNEEIRYWLPGNPSILFYATDVHNIEVSEQRGIIIRLF